ncbi:hypothetical protein GCM10012320_03000 [Sinomonas cellulolyticus]|nr:hypothetical protein GCM10012320_03000 [Sinomonas sp. KCTC 49339]
MLRVRLGTALGQTAHIVGGDLLDSLDLISESAAGPVVADEPFSLALYVVQKRHGHLLSLPGLQRPSCPRW